MSTLSTDQTVTVGSLTSREKGPWVAALTTVVTALLCNACCWLPPVLIGLTGTSAGHLSFLEPYKPYLIAFTGVQLTVGLLLVYRKPKRKHVCAPGHDNEANRRMNIRIMWAMVVFVVALNVWDVAKDQAKGAASVGKAPLAAGSKTI